jgi:TolB-like protein/class 3 adenylate cyclase/Tfp pilus assembly protein PilF
VNTEEFKRRLTAILSADVEGYSLLMREDEEATIRTLKTYRTAMRNLIQRYRGRVVDSPGDNILSEFSSVVDGVNCAVEIQRELAERNSELPHERRMRFRIGVNLGDVVEDGERIYGDGVNIAARMEGLAQGGGICISGTVYDQVKHKLGLEYEYLGEQEVKNMPEPIRAYRILSYPGAAAHRVVKAKRAVSKTWRNVFVAVGAILVVGAAVTVWHYYFRSPPMEVASVEKMAFPLPDKPSIAVLPFVNMSEDKEQDYLADGISENIISALSKVPNLFVIARNSTFAYKGKPVKVQKVAEDLGVRYVLEGSVQRSGDSIRITAQLIDAITGHHLWSERYDRELKNIFALQDEITMKIITALQVELTEGVQARVFGKGTDNLEAYMKFLQGREYVRRRTKDDNVYGRRLVNEAIALDPNYAQAYRTLAGTHMIDVWLKASKDPKQSLMNAIKLTQKAVALDASYASGHGLLGWLYTMARKHDEAIAKCERAVSLEPNGADVHFYYGMALRYAGRHEEAVQASEKAIRLNPFPIPSYLASLGMAYLFTGRYEKAIGVSKKAVNEEPNDPLNHIVLAAAYSLADLEDEARNSASEVLKIDPKFSLEYQAKILPFKNKGDLERFIAALRKAGLPDKPPLPLPDKPSIAVLPFVNMSGDPEQEYFSDGISEEIITALSKSSQLFVIARESSFSYKGKQAKVQQISRELGVRYILEGSVRKSEDRVRITAQLIDGIKGQHLWAERYDRDLKEIFALQDEITMKIVTALRIELTDGEQARMWGTKYENLDVFLKGMEAQSLWIKGTREGFIRHAQVAQEIINMAPESSIGYRLLAWNHWYLARIGKSPRENILKAFKLANKALSLDESHPNSHALLGSLYLVMRKYEKAIAAGERSVELDPNGAIVHANLGITLNYAGRPDEAIGYLKQGIRLNPYPAYWYYRHLGLCYMQKGQHEKALTEFKKALHRSPDAAINHVNLAMVYILLDRHEEARAAAKKVSEIDPDFSVKRALKVSPFKNQAFLKLLAEATHKAGLK